ncbi:MAG: hypothetical protein ABI459_02260 [Deltaproteobacteria bacterium]
MKSALFACFVVPLLALASPALAFMDCTSAAFGKLIDDKDFICKEVREQNYTAFNRQVVVRSLVDKEDPHAAGFEEEAFKSVEIALNTYSDLKSTIPLRIKNISIVISRNEANSNWEKIGVSVMGQAANAPDECVVALYPDRVFSEGEGPLAAMQSVVAHELFHCIQQATWPIVMEKYARHKWWIEGTANFASELAFPNIDREFAMNFEFSNRIRDEALTSLSYENLVFFAWLWQRDPARMFALADAIAGTNSIAQERSGILGVVKPDEMSQFIRDYVDGKVVGPDGYTPLTMVTNVGEVSFSDTETRNLVAVPMAMFALDVTFAAGSYDVTFAEKGNLNWQHKDNAKTEPWATGALKTEDNCETDTTYRFAGMAFDEAMLEVTATRNTTNSKDCTACQSYNGLDRCLVGTWIIENTQFGVSIGELLDDDGSTAVKVEGKNLIRFEDKGTSDWAYNNFFIAVQEALEGSPPIGATLMGTVSQTWSAEGGKLATCFSSANAGIVLNTPMGVGDVVNFNDIPDRPSTEYYNYECVGQNELILEKLNPGQPSFLMRLKRIE